jgi:hypothetical protein
MRSVDKVRDEKHGKKVPHTVGKFPQFFHCIMDDCKYEYLGLTCWWPDDSEDFSIAGCVMFEITGRDRATEFVGLPWTEKSGLEVTNASLCNIFFVSVNLAFLVY